MRLKDGMALSFRPYICSNDIVKRTQERTWLLTIILLLLLSLAPLKNDPKGGVVARISHLICAQLAPLQRQSSVMNLTAICYTLTSSLAQNLAAAAPSWSCRYYLQSTGV